MVGKPQRRPDRALLSSSPKIPTSFSPRTSRNPLPTQICLLNLYQRRTASREWVERVANKHRTGGGTVHHTASFRDEELGGADYRTGGGTVHHTASRRGAAQTPARVPSYRPANLRACSTRQSCRLPPRIGPRHHGPPRAPAPPPQAARPSQPAGEFTSLFNAPAVPPPAAYPPQPPPPQAASITVSEMHLPDHNVNRKCQLAIC